MKNIQVIDDAVNCTYDIYVINDTDFIEIFPDGNDIEFEDELFKRLGNDRAKDILSKLWEKRVDKKIVDGIHGTLFFGEHLCEEKKPFYPTKKEAEMIANP